MLLKHYELQVITWIIMEIEAAVEELEKLTCSHSRVIKALCMEIDKIREGIQSLVWRCDRLDLEMDEKDNF